nr:tetratricopeptide repeat protein [Bacteroidota bacterium]
MNDKAEQLYEQALHLIDFNRFDKAAQLLAQALAINPNYHEAFGQLAYIELQNKNLNKALEHALSCLACNAGYAYGHYIHAIILYKQGAYNKSYIAIVSALELSPNFAAAHDLLADIYLKKGKIEEAINSINEAIKLDPENSSYHASKSQLMKLVGDKTGAANSINTGLQFDIEDVETWYQKGKLELEGGFINEALECFQNALRLNPQNEVLKDAMLRSIKMQNSFLFSVEKYTEIKFTVSGKSAWLMLIPQFWGGVFFRAFWAQICNYISSFADLFYLKNSFTSNLFTASRKRRMIVSATVIAGFFLAIIIAISLKNSSILFFSYFLIAALYPVYALNSNKPDKYDAIVSILSLLVFVTAIVYRLYLSPTFVAVPVTILGHLFFNIFYFIRFKIFGFNRQYYELE